MLKIILFMSIETLKQAKQVKLSIEQYPPKEGTYCLNYQSPGLLILVLHLTEGLEAALGYHEGRQCGGQGPGLWAS